MIVLVDLDGVLADFEAAFAARVAQRWPGLVIARDARRTFRPADQYRQDLGLDVSDIMAAEGFYESLPPIPGGAAALAEMVGDGHDVSICTAPTRTWAFCVREKYVWVARHLGEEWVGRITMTRDKTQVLADVLIDDKPDITGRFSPSWSQVLFDQPYNRCLDLPRIVSWDCWRPALEEAASRTRC